MKWAYFASGFRESRGKHTGTKANAYAVRDLYDSTECEITYCEWNDSPEKYAQDLASQWSADDTLIVVGYSWGCGNWIYKFLHKLYKLNPAIKVNFLILIDPVIRSQFFSLRWLAITNWGTIVLPDSIEHCMVFFQREDEPNASKLRFKGDVFPVWSQQYVSHTKIDNAAEVREMVLKVAETYLSAS